MFPKQTLGQKKESFRTSTVATVCLLLPVVACFQTSSYIDDSHISHLVGKGRLSLSRAIAPIVYPWVWAATQEKTQQLLIKTSHWLCLLPLILSSSHPLSPL